MYMCENIKSVWFLIAWSSENEVLNFEIQEGYKIKHILLHGRAS